MGDITPLTFDPRVTVYNFRAHESGQFTRNLQVLGSQSMVRATRSTSPTQSTDASLGQSKSRLRRTDDSVSIPDPTFDEEIVETYEDDDDEDFGVDDVKKPSRKRKALSDEEDDDDDGNGDQDKDDEDEDEDDDEDDEDDDDERTAAEVDAEVEAEVSKLPGDTSQEDAERIREKIQLQRGPKKRGRKKLKIVVLEEGVFDDEGNPINITDDEVAIENEDPKGLEKVDENGNLLGGRQFRMKTFKVLGCGAKQYMVSTEPARLVGFRDSYLLFKTHRTLFKKVCSNEEKMDLIDRGLIPNSYKGRAVNLVAARSVFREFGAVMILDGKKVIDDFWEQRAIDRGDNPGDYADPNETIKYQSKLSAILGNETSTVSTGVAPLISTPLVNYTTDVSWMYQICAQTQEFNRKISESRQVAVTRGIKDIYTNLNFLPAHTQPHRSTTERLQDWPVDNEIVVDTRFVCGDLERRPTGLALVPKDVFDDIEDVALKTAILDQQAYEESTNPV